jgi:hypothetical protein
MDPKAPPARKDPKATSVLLARQVLLELQVTRVQLVLRGLLVQLDPKESPARKDPKATRVLLARQVLLERLEFLEPRVPLVLRG